ncbi:MAG: hypothetical protein NC930_07610, partial [Candidatus Omnitrophica bacterium]|nr:hypothetical protein [Candidatus Omnitrophota bacterium]
ILNQKGKALKGARILILGVTYKRDIDDVRESPALEIIEMLEKQGAHVDYTDPYVPELILHGKRYASQHIDSEMGRMGGTAADTVMPLRGSADTPSRRVTDPMPYDLAVLVTDHKCFDYEKIARSFSLILDTRNAYRGMRKDNVVRI